MEKVILVDERDKAIGTMEKMEAHEKGVLHRAFSVFIFNRQGELLMQQRAPGKYHSPGLWTNTCCSHPRENETIHEGAERRLFEEMGFKCDLKKVFHFTYYAEVGLGLIENEFDHVFFGFSEELPIINPSEVCNWKFAAMKEIKAEIQSHPDLFTAWFRIAFREVEKHLENFIFSPEQ